MSGTSDPRYFEYYFPGALNDHVLDRRRPRMWNCSMGLVFVMWISATSLSLYVPESCDGETTSVTELTGCGPGSGSAGTRPKRLSLHFSDGVQKMTSMEGNVRSILQSLVGQRATPELQRHVEKVIPGKHLLYLAQGTLLTHGMVYDKIFAFVEQQTNRIVDIRCDSVTEAGAPTAKK
jgi:hypothetical protein